MELKEKWSDEDRKEYQEMIESGKMDYGTMLEQVQKLLDIMDKKKKPKVSFNSSPKPKIKKAKIRKKF